MEELIKIKEASGQQLVSARELHEFLEVKSRFNDWIKNRITKYDFIDGIDYTKILVQCNRGQNEYDFVISLDMAKELSMVENNENGKKARRYFIACEKKLKEIVQPKLPSTYKEALIELLAKVEENEKLLLENNKISLENRLLNGEVFTWANKNLINALVRKYGATMGDFGSAWTEFKKNLLYKYSININSRMTAFLNNGGKKSKRRTLDMLYTDEEISNGIKTILSMCNEEDIDISDVIKHCSEN